MNKDGVFGGVPAEQIQRLTRHGGHDIDLSWSVIA
jgi:hypothetical protein